MASMTLTNMEHPHKLKILFICADIDAEKYFLEILNQELDIEAICTKDYEEAFERLKLTKFNVVIPTSFLPPKLIPTFVSTIKNQYPDTRIIVLSSYDNRDFISDLLNQGIDDFLIMPFASDFFIKRLREVSLAPARNPVQKRKFNPLVMATIQTVGTLALIYLLARGYHFSEFNDYGGGHVFRLKDTVSYLALIGIFALFSFFYKLNELQGNGRK